MPTLLVEDGYEVRFTSNDGSEPPHVHVTGNGGTAKVWLVPTIRLAGAARGYNQHRVGQIIRKTEAHRDEWLTEWRRHFGR